MSFAPAQIQPYISSTLGETCLSFGEKLHVGKVRDTYIINNKRVLITTDRQSAFDLNLAEIPFKGQVLNKCSEFWFRSTSHIIPNHLIAVPDPNISVVKDATVFCVEFVVRAYMTGSTETSIWVNYKNGVRNFCGHTLPEGIGQNEKLPKVIVTPTTKPETGHDESISREAIIERGLMSKEDFDYTEKKALELFVYGQEHCAKNGLILVDTKYEFGKTQDNEIILIDEIHTPDSSRFWDLESYNNQTDKTKAPKSFDKDVLRNWYSNQCDPYSDAVLPDAPDELITKLSNVYQKAYESITGEEFIPDVSEYPNLRMGENIQNYFDNTK